QIAQIGSVDLRMSVELAEVGVYQGGVQERRQSLGQREVEAAPVAVEVIQMVFEPDAIAGYAPGIVHNRHHPAIFLLGRETSDQDVVLVGHEQFSGAVSHQERVGFFRLGLGPLDVTTGEVCGINQGGGA